jgi:hypothetical protein
LYYVIKGVVAPFGRSVATPFGGYHLGVWGYRRPSRKATKARKSGAKKGGAHAKSATRGI